MPVPAITRITRACSGSSLAPNRPPVSVKSNWYPSQVTGCVMTSRVDVSREFVRLGDNRFQRGADESIAMRLASGQRPGVAPQEGQMW